jgi:hypothetical protein
VKPTRCSLEGKGPTRFIKIALMPIFPSGVLSPKAFHRIVPSYFASDGDEMPQGPDWLIQASCSIYEGTEQKELPLLNHRSPCRHPPRLRNSP